MQNKGSVKEFINFFEQNQEKLYRFAFSYLKNREGALDAVHDAIVKALQKRHTLIHAEYFETWFYKILINECLGQLRKNKRVLYLEEISDYSDGEAGALDSNEYIDLYEALDRLPPKLKTIVILRFFEERKLEEIAEITEVNLSTVKSRLYKALKLLRVDMEVEVDD